MRLKQADLWREDRLPFARICRAECGGALWSCGVMITALATSRRAQHAAIARVKCCSTFSWLLMDDEDDEMIHCGPAPCLPFYAVQSAYVSSGLEHRPIPPEHADSL